MKGNGDAGRGCSRRKARGIAGGTEAERAVRGRNGSGTATLKNPGNQLDVIVIPQKLILYKPMEDDT